MGTCLQYLSRYKDAYPFYSQAVQIALSLRMDKEDATEKDPVQLEFRRRIWADICLRELEYLYERGKPYLISMDIVKSSPKPTVTARDSEPYEFATEIRDALCLQLRLNSFTDLLHLLSAQYLIDGTLLPESLFRPQIYPFSTSRVLTGYCSYFKILSLPNPIEDKIVKRPKWSITTKEKLLIDQLFHIYLSTCGVGSIHPDREAFLESYYCNELEPAFVHTAVASTAVHLLLRHPETSLSSKLHAVVGSLFARAKRSLADVFNFPSPQIVLAFLNMDNCLINLSCYEDAYRFYSRAAQMALSLQMYKDVATEKSSEQLEFRRRIWAVICMRELESVYEFDKSPLISMDIIKSSPKPTVTARDNDTYKFATITTFSKLLELQNIDWALPDVIITQKLAGLAAYLQNERTELARYCNEGDLKKVLHPAVYFDFWFHWCALWRQFIKSDAPTGRLETNLMQRLRGKAFDEYVKVNTSVSHCQGTHPRHQDLISVLLASISSNSGIPFGPVSQQKVWLLYKRHAPSSGPGIQWFVDWLQLLKLGEILAFVHPFPTSI
ncbi:uncharacterized protein VTP21DRAFT_8122 [Calcarisporiella thermophila]|uniref:uncharacterized protein n=1 Tax=Calcarisporiella thermophila TaxID=911321 RepID=UPI003743FEC7